MKLHEFLFEVARQTTPVNENDLAKLKEKANIDVADWHDESKGLKGLYAKLHKGWMLQLLLMIALPFVVAYLTRLKNKLLFGENEGVIEEDDDVNKFFHSEQFK